MESARGLDIHISAAMWRTFHGMSINELSEQYYGGALIVDINSGRILAHVGQLDYVTYHQEFSIFNLIHKDYGTLKIKWRIMLPVLA